MVKTSYAWSIVSLLLVMLMSSAAWAATITGTVVNDTGRTGRIFVYAERTDDRSRSFGTSIPAEGPFTISGVIPGSYEIHAFVDTGTSVSGIRHANDPHGASAERTVGPNDDNVGIGAITVAAPTPAVSVQAPVGTVYGGSGANYVKWVGPTDSNFYPIAERYTVQWSNDPPNVITGESGNIRSGYDDVFLHRGGASTLSYRVIAHVGATSAASPWISVVSPPPSSGSITGTVSFPAGAAGPLFVAAINETVDPPVIRVAAIGSQASPPTSPATYTITNVPAGNYNVIAFLDRNNNGSFDVGDAGMVDTNDYTPLARVSNAEVTVPDIALEGGNAATIISTGHGKSDTAEWFNLVLTAQSMRKQVVGATLTGPQLGEPVTLGLQKNGNFHTRIPMGRQSPGQSYQAVLDFSDGTSETVTEQVTAVLNAFATPVAPVGNIVFNARPQFSWTAPSAAPSGDYLYSIWLTNDSTGAAVWNAWGVPSTTSSIAYGGPNLVDGTKYKWILNVTDANGNMAAREVTFTPTTSAAFSTFTPAGGPAGTVVTITGVNLSTNPAPTVRFGNVPATVTSSTSSSITTTVPPGAVAAPISVNSNGTEVESDKIFYVGQPITITGRVQTLAGSAIPSARVEAVDSPDLFTTTDANGSFTLQPVFPGQTVTLWITATGYVPTYSAAFPMDQDNRFLTGQQMNLTPYPFHLYTQAQLNGWGVTAGRGMIAGQLLNDGLQPFAAVSGATVATTPPYTVNYYNGTTVTGTSTAANGTFVLFDVPEQWIQAQGQKAGWVFYTGNFQVRAGSVTEGAILGSTAQPTIAYFTPVRGKRGSTVTITGVNFAAVPAENVVTFGNIQVIPTAATANQLTVTVPASAVTSDLSITARGVTTTLSNQPFTVLHTLAVGVAGAGTVNSNPTGIACSGTTGCSADFARGSTVTLMPSASAGSTFSTWSGSCSGTGNCQVVMNGDLNATAIFTSNNAIRVGSTFYSTLASALAAAPPGSRIEMQAGAFPVSTISVDKSVRIVGGYNSTFSANTGFSTLFGTLLVQNGELRVERINVR